MATLNIDSANELKAKSENWVPLEANAEVFNDWAHKLGLAECEQFVDVYGLDDDLLSMVPQPVKALLLLFPISKNYENERHAQTADITRNGQGELDNTLVFFPQKVPNACGTMALLHAMANSPVTIAPGSHLAKLFENAANQNSEERAQAVVDASFLRTAHASSAQAGQSEAPNANDDVDLHFVTFVLAPAAVSEGTRLIELDGRKMNFPNDIPFSGSSQDLLKDASAVVKEKFMKHDPGNINFALIALTTQEEY